MSAYVPRPQDEYNDDRIAGWIIVGMAMLYAVMMLLTTLGILALMGVPGAASRAEQSALRTFFAMEMILHILIVVLNIIIGAGITRSARWAFIAGLVLNTLLALTNMALMLAFDDLATLATIMIAVFCYLRLSGRVGPKPV